MQGPRHSPAFRSSGWAPDTPGGEAAGQRASPTARCGPGEATASGSSVTVPTPTAPRRPATSPGTG